MDHSGCMALNFLLRKNGDLLSNNFVYGVVRLKLSGHLFRKNTISAAEKMDFWWEDGV